MSEPRRCGLTARFMFSNGRRRAVRCVFEADGHVTHYTGYYEPGRWGFWWKPDARIVERVQTREEVI